MPGVQELNKFNDVKIVDYGFRSITGVPYPLDINSASRETIESLPGIGKKRVIRIFANRPFKNKEDFLNVLDESEIGDQILDFLSF